MANDLTASPLIIDTASSTMLVEVPIFIKRIRWVGATTAGHQVIIQDVNGRVLWESVAAGANNVESESQDAVGLWPTGFKVPTLGSGKLYIYYE